MPAFFQVTPRSLMLVEVEVEPLGLPNLQKLLLEGEVEKLRRLMLLIPNLKVLEGTPMMVAGADYKEGSYLRATLVPLVQFQNSWSEPMLAYYQGTSSKPFPGGFELEVLSKRLRPLYPEAQPNFEGLEVSLPSLDRVKELRLSSRPITFDLSSLSFEVYPGRREALDQLANLASLASTAPGQMGREKEEILQEYLRMEPIETWGPFA